jgi:hypothetical protein
MKPIVIIAISVLIIGVSITSISAQSQSEIPDWVKGVADFWVKGNISDSEFGESISFLIEQNIIQVEIPKVDDSETVNKIMNLEIENRLLKIENKKLQAKIDDINSKPIAEEIDPYQLTIQELKEQAVTWKYDDILRNEEYYVGKIIHLTGEISAIEKYSGDDSEYAHWVLLTVDTGDSSFGDGYFGDSMYVWYDGSRLLMGDIVEVYLIIDDIIEKEFLKGYPSYYPLGTAMHVTCTSC